MAQAAYETLVEKPWSCPEHRPLKQGVEKPTLQRRKTGPVTGPNVRPREPGLESGFLVHKANNRDRY